MSKQVQEVPRQMSPLGEFKASWQSNKHEIAAQLPTGVDPDRFIRTVITTVQGQPELLQADRNSLYNACMNAAKDGLLPDGREATIQIYNTKIKDANGNDQWVKMAQYMPMVRGLIKSMYAAGCTKVEGHAVYEKDHFVYMLGDDPKIEHGPYLGGDDAGKVIAAYAIVKLENGEVKREVMPRRDIEKVREASKASNGPGWTIWYDQFAIKAVLKRIYKQVPGRSDEFEKISNADNEAMGFTFDAKPDDKPLEIPKKTAEEKIVEVLGPEPTRAEKLKEQLKKDGIDTKLASEIVDEASQDGDTDPQKGDVDLDQRSEAEQLADEAEQVPAKLSPEHQAFVDDMEKADEEEEEEKK